ncbi:hypothetical protein [Neorhizobium sp. JUb45]|jgi:plasmid stability protein|uniref:FitA-like ribbon-helix-helix domain-containing protein n=1 Tax=unclassified Neorhizobium TaxID=2629175 RepID=UPI001047FF9F|nr:hypothetical protein [Neorhizobium sp. JUb45]TCR04497.1 hypothetical protein EDF70_102596 [Neorhizobium sp. JUb45]
MNAITIRNLSEEATRELEARAVDNGTTVEEEAQRILQEILGKTAEAEDDEPEVGLGTALRRLGEKFPELADIDFSRDQTPARGPSFE